MALSIKNAETEQLARALAEATGQSITDAVTLALRTALQAEHSTADAREAKLERLRSIARDAGRRWPEELRGVDHGDLLYDEDGLPR